MNIFELKEKIIDFVEIEYTIEIPFELISSNNGFKEYNRIVREQVLDLTGIYIWENFDTGNILYIGMAGKVNQQGNLVNHSVRKRLQASRKKDEVTNRDIQTNEYIYNLMVQENCFQLNIYVIHLTNGQMPGYIEAVLINAFYQANNCLPLYNNAF